jgi:hypothetical protein
MEKINGKFIPLNVEQVARMQHEEENRLNPPPPTRGMK